MTLYENTGEEPTLDYELLEEMLAEAECESTAAEFQGFLCGLLAAGVTVEDMSWKLPLAELFNQGLDLPQEIVAELVKVFLWTAAELAQQDSLAPLFLPDDSYPAVDQLEALVDWCDGFLLGFGLKIGDSPIENAEIGEALKDLSEICQLDLDVEEGEETQEALFTLMEHIRVAVQVLHWETTVQQPSLVKSTAAEKPTLH